MKYKILSGTILVLLYVMWATLVSELYFDVCMHAVLGSSVTVPAMLQFWFYWHTMPAALILMIFVLLWVKD